MIPKRLSEMIKSIWKATGYSLIVAVVIAFSIKSAIADWNVVPTGSMKPTIIEGDRIFVNKVAYDLKLPFTTFHLVKWGNPDRGDIVVFYSPVDGKRLVKRVIGVPGDKLSMKNNLLVVNDTPIRYKMASREDDASLETDIKRRHYVYLDEYLGSNPHKVMLSGYSIRGSSLPSFTIPANKYFMMGDNRDNSADSRYFGFVDRKSVVGKATSIVISLNPDKYYKPRSERFFKHLM